ncbi:hypothetical protein ACP0HM_31290 [Escherichia coli]
MRKIIHVDMDCFFRSGGDARQSRPARYPYCYWRQPRTSGVISTANYPARKFGVRSAMPTGDGAQIMPASHLASGALLTPTKKPQIISAKSSRATPRVLNRCHWMRLISTSPIASIATVLRPLIAREIRQTIFNELQLTASAGVAPVKFLAKIASDME